MKKLFFMSVLLLVGSVSIKANDQKSIFDTEKSGNVLKVDGSKEKDDWLKQDGIHCFERDGNGDYKEIVCPEIIIITDETDNPQ